MDSGLEKVVESGALRGLSWQAAALNAQLARHTPDALLEAARVATDATIASRLLAAGGERWSRMAQVTAARRIMSRLDLGQLQDLRRTRVYVAGNATLKPLVDALPVFLFARGFDAAVAEAGFDQWTSELLDPNSPLYRFDPAFVVIYLSSLGLTQAATRAPAPIVATLLDGLAQLKARSSATPIIVLPEPLEEERDGASPWVAWRNRLVAEIREKVGEGTILLDPAPFIAEIGGGAWHAPRYWYHGKIPAHPNALTLLARPLAAAIAQSVYRPVKVIACDLDNTLWGGVVGEDGWQSLALDPFEAGAPYLRLQRLLKELKGKGFLLVAVSKNNESDAREVFARRPEMVLAWDDFAAVRVNWEPKSANLAALAEELRLDLSNFLYLDDSPFERDEVRHALPAVMVLDLPEAPEDYIGALLRTNLLLAPIVTGEDRERTELYRREAERGRAGAHAGNVEEFLATLGLKAKAERIGPDNLQRVVQLINKTNQFNLTTPRYDIEAVQRFAADERAFAYCYRVEDAYGDAGITGVLIARPDAKDYAIDTWLMSCRVMGRTVEYAMFAHLAEWLRTRGIASLRGEFRPTAKNMPTERLLPDLGFAPLAGAENGSVYRYDLSQPFTANRFVELVVTP